MENKFCNNLSFMLMKGLNNITNFIMLIIKGNFCVITNGD